MTKQTIGLQLFLSFALTTLAQNKQSVFKSGFDFNIGTSTSETITNGTQTNLGSGNGIHFTFTNSIGKFKNEKDLVYYGLVLGLDHGVSKDANNQKSTVRNIITGVVVGKQKFIELAPKLYYLPEVFLLFTYTRGRNSSDFYPDNDQIGNQFFKSINLIPFGVGFKIKPNLMTNFSIGNIGASYTYSIQRRENSGNDVKLKNTAFQLKANSSVFEIGLIYFLKIK